MKNKYFIDLQDKTYISVWQENIDNTQYDLLINKTNKNDIVIGTIVNNELFIEQNKEKLKKIIFQMIKNIKIFME